jgi:D-lyxose ketol-isomerase
MNPKDFEKAKAGALALLGKARIRLTPLERETMEVTDLGLGDIRHVGLQVVVYENNDRYCAKELVLLPRQICPEHKHPWISAANPGKQETFRCRWGEVYLYVAGEPSPKPRARVPAGHKPYLNVRHEVVLRPGDQYTIPPGGLHWFQAGDKGAVISEFSSASTDGRDVFTDPRARREG